MGNPAGVDHASASLDRRRMTLAQAISRRRIIPDPEASPSVDSGRIMTNNPPVGHLLDDRFQRLSLGGERVLDANGFLVHDRTVDDPVFFEIVKATREDGAGDVLYTLL